jgi:putative oxidoreductase
MKGLLRAWTPHLLSVLRIVTAFLFLAHGTQKLLGFPAPFSRPVELFSLTGLAGALAGPWSVDRLRHAA